MTAKSDAERHAAMRDRRRRKNLARVEVWIPDTQRARDEIKDHAARLRGES